jgi:hypothetical protein
MTEVLRHHLQEELLVYIDRGGGAPNSLTMNFKPICIYPGYSHIMLRLHSAALRDLSLMPWDEMVYVKVTLGAWSCRTHSVKVVAGESFCWELLETMVILDEGQLRHGEASVELYVERQISEPVMIGACTMKLGESLSTKHKGMPVDLLSEMHCPQYGKGQLVLKMSADEEKHLRSMTPELTRQIALQRQSREKSRTLKSRHRCRLLEEQHTFDEVLSSLRGDPTYYLQALTGTLSTEQISESGFQINSTVCRVYIHICYYECFTKPKLIVCL